jgi:hypothetical protein
MLNVYTPTTRIAATHVVDILEGDLTQAVVACELRNLSFVDRGAYACRSSVVLECNPADHALVVPSLEQSSIILADGTERAAI